LGVGLGFEFVGIKLMNRREKFERVADRNEVCASRMLSPSCPTARETRVGDGLGGCF